MKNALRDWRLPLILAAPVLLLAGVLYLALQPLPGATAANRGSGLTVIWGTTPLPTYVPTPYPSVAPVTPVSGYVLPCSTGVTSMTVTPAVANGRVTLKATDQGGRPVVCAWFSQRGGNYGVLGGTDTTGTVSAALAAMPRNTHIVEVATLGNVTAGVDFFVER